MIAISLALLVPLFLGAGNFETGTGTAPTPREESGCVQCHQGLEAMHPEAELSCTDCHGGNADADTKQLAHVAPRRKPTGDERVAPLDSDLAWRRFQNPMDLRVAGETCGDCHGETVARVLSSLHGTTAGHLSDGFYEVGAFKQRGSQYSVFPVRSSPREGGEVEKLGQIPVPARTTSRTQLDLAHHFADLARKECMQCHLYSGGRAVRGRVGFDGDYRGEGCAACHVSYLTDGLTRSADRKAPHGEPGHPATHQMMAAPDTNSCTHCHYGDASIGLNFRGLSQLPPGAPGGPDIPGTTNAQLNRVFYLNDPAIVPPDVHHERGMHCIDCHTNGDVMGDGMLHGQMEHAVEISCEACHGTFTEPSTLRTERGTVLDHLRRVGDDVYLVSRVDGKSHRVPQVVHVLDPARHEYNPRASKAMTERHSGIECYTCHAAWNSNFLGFHFTRNESLKQLDLITGKRTPGLVTTQEKVFSTWKSFYAGLNETGRVAPYLTGFSMMGSVYDKDGVLIMDQVMPETAAGLSGMSMIHHQLHSIRPSARQCVECHRAPGTWGLGTSNFRLGRKLAFAADRRGIEVVAINRESPAESLPLAKLVVPDVVDLALRCDDIQGHARTLFAAEGGRGIHAIDVSVPTHPRQIGFVACAQPRGLYLDEPYLYVANGEGGLSIFDVSDPLAMTLVGRAVTFDAHDVTVAWPWAYVADGPGGLVIVDVRVPISPKVISAIDINGKSPLPNDVTHVEVLFQYSRPRSRDDLPVHRRSRARHMAAVLDQEYGMILVDVTEPTAPTVMYPYFDGKSQPQSRNEIAYRGLVFSSHVDLAEAQGGSRTAERDYVYYLRERSRNDGSRRSEMITFDVSNPKAVERVESIAVGYATESLTSLSLYSSPFLRSILIASGNRGVYLTDSSISAVPTQIGAIPGLRDAFALVVEEFPLDRMVRQDGKRLKDVSHDGSRWLNRSELEDVLTVPASELNASASALPLFGGSARAHFSRFDEDDSGFLIDEEFEAAGGSSLDRDGDQRISMLELADKIGLLTARKSGARDAVVEVLESRTSAEGDLARLLDGINPWSYDRDDNDVLDRNEMKAAVFEALDLDQNGSLDADEYSRAPGKSRELRFGNAVENPIFRSADDNRDGRISLREFELEDEAWTALDRDGANEVVLNTGTTSEEDKARAWVPRTSEWPTRRVYLSALPPVCSAENLMALLDSNGDEWISRRELRGRPELFAELDRDRNERVEEAELVRGVERMAQGGVGFSGDEFLRRWDVNGDGTLDVLELPEWAQVLIARRADRR